MRALRSVGCLISGGCLRDASVPLNRFVDAIAKIKRDLGLTIAVHTSVIDPSTARRFKGAGVDASLIDVISSDKALRKICQLKVKVVGHDKSLRALHESWIPLVPHVLVGLPCGRLRGELQALKIISE